MRLSKVIAPGATVMVPIAEIMTWTSCDDGGPHVHNEECIEKGNACHWSAGKSDIGKTAWEVVLDRKRSDHHYRDVVESIREHGFLQPLTGQVNSFERRFGDGHHRLAAAIDLGYTEVPIKFFSTMKIRKDSGSWYAGMKLSDRYYN